jgi:serine phosphatase RsbU (regulator of sigma subunit)
VRYANAGHPAPLVLSPDGELPRLDETALADDRGGARPRAPHRLRAHRGAGEVRAGAILVLYTDGFTDVAGEDADARTTPLERIVARAAAEDVAEEDVTGEVFSACLPEELRDDVALLVVRLDG